MVQLMTADLSVYGNSANQNMLTATLCLILVLNIANTAHSCKSDYPVAFMCQTSTVRGPGVTLDVSTAATTSFTTCSCSVTSNTTGFIVEFSDNPNATNCGSQLDLFFKDISMQLKCGVPASGQSSNGATAKIHYKRDTNVDNIDSEYCLSFHSNRSDVEFILSCDIEQTTIASTSLSQTSEMTTSSRMGSVQTSNNTIPYSSSTISSSQTLLSTNEIMSSTSLPPVGTSTTLQTSKSTLALMSSSVPTSLSTTLTSVVTKPKSNASTQTPTKTSTPATVNKSTPSYTTTSSSLAQENTTTISSAVTSPITRNTTHTTTTTTLSNVTTTTSTTAVFTTLTTRNTTTLSTRQYNETLSTPTNKNNTLASNTTLPSTKVSLFTENLSKENATRKTTMQYSLNTTKDATNHGTTQTTTIINTRSNSSHTTRTVTNSVKPSTNPGNTSVNTTEATPGFTTPSGIINFTKQHENTTGDYVTLTTNVSKETTRVYDNSTSTSITPVSPLNYTTELPFNSTELTTQTTESNTNVTESTNTTQTTENTNVTTTAIVSNVTEVTNGTSFENTTTVTQETTEFANITTTGSYNGTTDNSTGDPNITIDTNTTAKPVTTTSGFWEPPIQDYDVPPRSNNIVVILVPVAGTLLLIFIAVVVYIMCKRSKKASRRTRVPNITKKTDKNGNIAGRGNIMGPNANVGPNEKPENPGDLFVTQSNGKPAAQYKIENEKTLADKPYITDNKNEREVLDEGLNATLNGDTLTSTGKPKPYKPTEREKDLLEHLELSAIVIESDPDDPNRYFRKTDPGDWYRVIMKGKKPRDSEEPSDKSGEKGRHERKKKSKSSGSENETVRTKQRRRKQRDRKHRRHSEIGLSNSSKRKSKDRYSSSDSFDKTLSDNEDDIKALNTVNQQTRYVLSQPSKQQVSTNVSERTNPPRKVVSKSADENDEKPEPVKTRVIVSKPSSVSLPTPMSGNKTEENIVMQTADKPISHTRKDNLFNSDSFTSSTSSGSELNTVPQRNTSLQGNQRNSIFGSRSKLNAQNTKEKEADIIPVAKRPDIVPPLNLTDTGDKVGRLEDGFEEFILGEC